MEYPSLVLRLYPDSAIYNGYPDAFPWEVTKMRFGSFMGRIRGTAKGHRSAVRGELYGVAQQVKRNLVDLWLIGFKYRHIMRDAAFQRNALLLRQGANRAQDPFHNLVRMDRAAIEGHPASLYF